MTLTRRGSLWQALGDIVQDQELQYPVQKVKGKQLFKAAVRLVLEYRSWINVDPTFNGQEIQFEKTKDKKSKDRKNLTLQDRSVLLIDPVKRTKENRAYIWQLLDDLLAFKKYGDILRDDLALVCRYQYVPVNRVVVRQGQKAENLYYVIEGELNLSKTQVDFITGEERDMKVGSLHSGDIFGEISLLHRVPRTMTITSKTPVDLLFITRGDFNRILKIPLSQEWDILQDAMVNFNYFKGWTESMIRECCILSKVENYQSNEIIIGDGKGKFNYVYFVLHGECKLIEHMIIEEKISRGKVQYKLFNPIREDHETRININQKEERKNVRELNNTSSYDDRRNLGTHKNSLLEYVDYHKNDQSSKFDLKRMSVVTATLQDVVTQWHEITEVAAMLMRKPSTLSQQKYPKNVKTIFMQICIFYRGACFALGENMKNRRIISVTPLRCLLIPRYWLMKHNRANIWGRVKLFMDSKYPNTQELFRIFLMNRRWIKYRKDFVQEIIERKCRQTLNDTLDCDVPYSIRINRV